MLKEIKAQMNGNLALLKDIKALISDIKTYIKVKLRFLDNIKP